MKRILFIATDYPPRKSGQAALGAYVVQSFRDKNAIVEVVNIEGGDGLFRALFDLFSKFRGGFWFKILLIIFKFGINYDVVIAGDGKSALFASVYGFAFRKKVVFMCHGLDFEHYGTGISWPIKRFFLAKNNLVIANSQYTLDRFKAMNIASNIIVINPPVDTNLFKPMDIKDIKERYTDHGRIKIILSVSRLIERKGIDLVLIALSQISSEFVYIIIGNGPENKKIKRLIGILNLEDKVILLSDMETTTLLYYYNLCDIFVLTPYAIIDRHRVDYEGFGRAYLEANACGKPVIGSRSGGIPDAIKENFSGILVPENNVVELRDSITKILANDNLLESLASNGIKWAKLFDTKTHGYRYWDEIEHNVFKQEKNIRG